MQKYIFQWNTAWANRKEQDINIYNYIIDNFLTCYFEYQFKFQRKHAVQGNKKHNTLISKRWILEMHSSIITRYIGKKYIIYL